MSTASRKKASLMTWAALAVIGVAVFVATRHSDNSGGSTAGSTPKAAHHDCILAGQDELDLGNLVKDIQAGTVTNDEVATKLDRLGGRMEEHAHLGDVPLDASESALAVDLRRAHVTITDGGDMTADVTAINADLATLLTLCP